MTKHVTKIGEKTLYNLDNQMFLSEWLKIETKDLKTYEVPKLSSSIQVSKNAKSPGYLTENALGCFLNQSNSTHYNSEQVCLFSICPSNGSITSIIPKNFEKICAAFTARKCIKQNWITERDEYMVPNHD